MAERKIFILEEKENPWCEFLQEFFEDTPSRIHLVHDAKSAGDYLGRAHADMALVNPKLLTLPIVQKMKVLRQSFPDFRLFGISAERKLADAHKQDGLIFDDLFDGIPPLIDFQKRIAQHLPVPDSIRVLVIDDEAEIGEMIKDFLGERTHPTFDVTYTADGKKGLHLLEAQLHDVVVLDVKMPILDGREVYREIKKKGLKIPVIVFFDAISGDEMVDIREIGRPAVVEKGARQSAMPEMMALIKKMVYFG